MRQILGIDVGGTKIAIGLVNEQFKISQLQIVPTSQKDLTEQIKQLIAGYKGYKSIGLAVPGQVLPSGQVLKLPNIPSFKPANLKNILNKAFKVPVTVMNDAKAFALAEAKIGGGKGKPVVAGVILGTGIGVGIVMNGEVYFGKDGLAGELEHVVLPDGKMLRYHRKAAGVLRRKEDAKHILLPLITSVTLSFNPDVIILGGGWSKLPGVEKLISIIAKNAGGYRTSTMVKTSKMVHPGVIGATLPLTQGLKK